MFFDSAPIRRLVVKFDADGIYFKTQEYVICVSWELREELIVLSVPQNATALVRLVNPCIPPEVSI